VKDLLSAQHLFPLGLTDYCCRYYYGPGPDGPTTRTAGTLAQVQVVGSAYLEGGGADRVIARRAGSPAGRVGKRLENNEEIPVPGAKVGGDDDEDDDDWKDPGKTLENKGEIPVPGKRVGGGGCCDGWKDSCLPFARLLFVLALSPPLPP
jgi:hypothetical protein